MNRYLVCKNENIVIGFTSKGESFFFDKTDFEYLKNFGWHLSKRGYISTKSINRKEIPMHKLLIKNSKGYDIDHISRNKLDNRRSNLRICTHQQNTFNQNKRCTNTSGYIGVSKLKKANGYESYIHHNGKKHYLGLYPDAISAALARDNKAKELFGEYANLNFKDKVMVCNG